VTELALAEREATLVTRTREGSKQQRDAAFMELVAIVQPRLIALCAKMLGNAHDAADVVQDVLVLAHRGLPRFQAASRFSTWVFRIAVREALHHRAKTDRRATSGAASGCEMGRSPEPRLEARETLRKAHAALLSLPAEHRVILSLFAVQGLGHAEIAEILGVPEGTVWRRVHEARKAICAQLDAGPEATKVQG
jgi:RNA polymerase sigma-70 factor (ECF subfamily)